MRSEIWFLAVLVLAVVVYWLSGRGTSDKRPFVADVVKVVDGDGLYLAGIKPQIRLWGVDAPEYNQHGGAEAKRTLTRLALGKRIRCQKMDQDHYGRIIARCFLPNGQEINRLMIESGHAREYKRFTKGFYSRH